LEQDFRPRAKNGLKATLKREPFYREPIDDDLAYLWAAYRLDGLPETYVRRGLDKDAFMVRMVDLIASVADAKILMGPRNGVPCPVGLATIGGTGERLQPHAVWFPWATARNKIECTSDYLNNLRRERSATGRYLKGIIFAREETWTFFNHIMRRGILKRCGKIERWFDDNTPAMLYYTREPDCCLEARADRISTSMRIK